MVLFNTKCSVQLRARCFIINAIFESVALDLVAQMEKKFLVKTICCTVICVID